MKHTFLFILNLLFVATFISCTDSEEAVYMPRNIQFSYNIASRTDARNSGKNYFYEGDRIYISATFTLDGSNSIKQTEVATITDGLIPTTMEWPENATGGTFTAWFAGNSLPDESETIAINPRNDLLKTTVSVTAPEENIKLVFQHALIRIIVTGIQKDEILTVSSPAGTDGIVSFDTNLSSEDNPLASDNNGISLTLAADDNTFYLQQWTQPLTLQSDKAETSQSITCPDIAAATGKSYTIIFRQ